MKFKQGSLLAKDMIKKYIPPKEKVGDKWSTCITCGGKIFSKGHPKYCIDCKKI